MHESLNRGLFGDNISEFNAPETEIAITKEACNVSGLKSTNSSHDLFSDPVEYARENNPPVSIKNSHEKPHDLGKKLLAREGAKRTWKKVQKQTESTKQNPTQPTISSSKKRILREKANISKGSVSSTKRTKFLEVTHNDICSMVEATDQHR